LAVEPAFGGASSAAFARTPQTPSTLLLGYV
jgi:hypothetical protein